MKKETFNLEDLDRPATYEEGSTKCSPCVGHDKDFVDAEERLEKVKEATKYDGGKPSFTSIPQKALLEVAKGFTYGMNKYGQYNYSGSMNVTRYLDALSRHLNQYLTGESIDESGIHHLALVCCNAMMALDGIYTGNTIENINPVYKKNDDKEEGK